MSDLQTNDIALIIEEIRMLESGAKAQIHDLHVIMNYLIKQLDIFDKLNQKYPNILTFKTAITESQEVVEKIIIIQEQNQKCLNSLSSIHKIMLDKDAQVKELERKLEVLRMMVSQINGVFIKDEQPLEHKLSEFQNIMLDHN